MIAEVGLQVDTVHGYDLDQENTLEINEKITKAAVRLGAPIVVFIKYMGFLIGTPKMQATRNFKFVQLGCLLRDEKRQKQLGRLVCLISVAFCGRYGSEKQPGRLILFFSVASGFLHVQLPLFQIRPEE